MQYRQRTSKAVSAWISDSDYTHGGEVVCGLRHVYRGVWGCPAWAAGEPCSYCFLGKTVRGKTELLKGVAWADRCGVCRGSGKITDPSPPGEILWAKCFCCKGTGTPQPARRQDLAPARAAVEKWLSTNPHTLCEHQGTKTAGEPCSNPGLWCDPPMLLNTGEYTDSLGWTPEENPHAGMLLDLFSDPETNPHGHKLLFVSKAGLEATERHLEGRQPSENVILSWSVGNAGPRQEPYWPLPSFEFGSRLAAASWAQHQGWRVRLRIDPLVGARGFDSRHSWHARGWGRVVAESQGAILIPELITFGTLRHQGGRVMLPDEERVGIYRDAIEGLRGGGYEGPVGLCKETPDMIRTVLGIEPHEMRCNCLP